MTDMGLIIVQGEDETEVAQSWVRFQRSCCAQSSSYCLRDSVDGLVDGASNGAVVAAAVVVSVDVACICLSLFFSRCRSGRIICLELGTGISPSLYLSLVPQNDNRH